MALTYAQSAALMTDATFVSRVKVAVLKYAGAIMVEATSATHHNARHRWAVSVTMGPDSAAQAIAAPTVMDPQVQLDGGAITDAALQASVEAAINNAFI
jgi:hypothetical protein